MFDRHEAAQQMTAAAPVGFGPKLLDAGYAGEPAQPESELQYAARQASESLMRLEKSVHELASRLQVVLSADTPSPTAPGAERAGRAVSSQIATALVSHAVQTDSVDHMVRNLLRRLVL